MLGARRVQLVLVVGSCPPQLWKTYCYSIDSQPESKWTIEEEFGTLGAEKCLEEEFGTLGEEKCLREEFGRKLVISSIPNWSHIALRSRTNISVKCFCTWIKWKKWDFPYNDNMKSSFMYHRNTHCRRGISKLLKLNVGNARKMLRITVLYSLVFRLHNTWRRTFIIFNAVVFNRFLANPLLEVSPPVHPPLWSLNGKNSF